MTTPVASINVNLAALQSRLLIRLQHLLDVLAVSVLGTDAVDEAKYAGFATFFSISPAQNQRLSRDAAATEAVNWYLRTAFRDAIEATNLFLDECRTVAAVYKSAAGHALTVGAFNQIVGSEADKFHRIGLPDKLEALKTDFSVGPDLASHLVSINAVRNCLVHRLGVVGPKDVNEGGELVLRWHVFAMFAKSPDGNQELPINPENAIVGEGWSVTLRAVDRSRTFTVGQQIELSYDEIVQTFMTIMQFGMQMTEALQGLAQVKPSSSAGPEANGEV